MRARSTETAPDRSSLHSAQLLPGSGRPTAALVDLNALSWNFNEVVRRAPGRKILAVVKAQAYGHGAVAVSRHLLKQGAHMLGVALVEEGRELREAGIGSPVLIMGALFPEQADSVVELALTPVVFSLPVAQALSRAAIRSRTKVSLHIKVDTGMGRIGIDPESVPRFLEQLQPLEGIEVQGLMTHFADADLRDKQFSAQQIDRFEMLLRTLEGKGMHIPLRHAANSAAVLDFERALFTMVRPGLMLYGYDPAADKTGGRELKQVLSLVTRVAFLKKVPAGTSISYGRTFTTRRESLIATLPIGYADGYDRALSNKGEALVRGVRVPVVGRVCMDMCMVDVTGVPDVSEQDQVILIGRQGTERITADDIAEKTGTIAYEVLCGISSRVPRIIV
jgi:alanine racemase